MGNLLAALLRHDHQLPRPAVIGLLKETLTADLHWTESDYGNIIVCFQLAYALSLLFVGRVIDWVGTKLGYGLSLAVWSMGCRTARFCYRNRRLCNCPGSAGCRRIGQLPGS